MTDNIFDEILIKFDEFLSLVGNVLSNEKEIHLIKNKIRRHFNTTSSAYLCSKDFQTSLNHIHNVFNKNDKSTKYFLLLNSFDGQLKKHSIKLLKSHQSSNEVTQHTKSTTEEKTSISESKQKKKIHKLERQLSSLSKVIRELEEKELSLDEMRYSDLYVVEANLKKQAYEVFIKLAELKNQPVSVERILDKPITLTENGIDHPLINKALEDMINQKRFLPSFDDILDTVDKTNEKFDLKLSVSVRKTFAEKSFKIIGAKIKDRRMADFNDIMTSRLSEDFDIERNDPALENVEIEKILLENEREAITKTEKIFETFSQIDPSHEEEVNIESPDASTTESEDDYDEKGEEEDINKNDEADSESEIPVDSFHDEHDKYQYDAVDILPPFSPTFSPPSLPTINEILHSKGSVEDAPISRTSRIASIPLKRAIRSPLVIIDEPEVYTIDDDNDIQESQSSSVTQKHTVHTVVPRRREQSFFHQRLINSDLSISQKRLSKDTDSSNCKKRKEDSEFIIMLD